MSLKDILAGRIYFDDKLGLREVVEVAGAPVRVRYRLLAAKIEHQWVYGDVGQASTKQSLIGTESTVTLEAFASWAKHSYDTSEKEALLLQVQAKRLKLSAGEVAFMASVRSELGKTASVGTLVSYDHTEGRAVAGLQRKGLLTKLPGGEVQLLALGVARLDSAADEGERNDEPAPFAEQDR